MESDPVRFFQQLKEFTKNLKEGPRQCLRLLETLNRNLIEEQINSSFIDLFLIHIFEKSNGLMLPLSRKNSKKAVLKALEILYTLVNNFSNRLVRNNILDIYTLCNVVIKLHTVSEIKVKALELLLISFEKLDSSLETNDLSNVYTELLDSLQFALKQKHCDTVKHKELIALGYFAKRYQYLISNPRDLRLLFVRNLDTEFFKPKKSQNIICGFFIGFSYFCESFPLDITKSEDKTLVEKLYRLIHSLVIPTDKTKFGNRAALSFLANHITLFGNLLLKDYKYWHMKLLQWLEMGMEERKVGAVVLKAYFQEISSIICDPNVHGDCISIVKFFNNWYIDVSKKNNIQSYEKRLSIHCLKFFSRASYKYLPHNEITDLFLEVMQSFEHNYILNYNPNGEEWEYLPDYIQTVANFMRYKSFKASEFYCLQRAVINMIKSFHQLPYAHHYLVVDGIIITCFYLKKTQYFDPFLENLIYQGIVWSCSHQHVSNAEFSETSENVITVKHFFPLWHGLLKLPSNRTYDKYGLYLDDRKYILERIVNQLVKTLMILINKLNVSLKPKDDRFAVTEVEKAYQVEQKSDHAIFLNVVDLYQEIMDNIEPKMFKKCICKMIKHILSKCIIYPLISGFYKLLSYSLKIVNKLNLFEESGHQNQDVINMKETLKQFLEVLLDNMAQYKDELLLACLKVLLESPSVLVKDVLSICITPFTTVFQLGRSYFPLAETGLNTLLRWQENIDVEEFDDFMSKIIPSLDSYLRSKSLLGQTHSNLSETRRKTAQALKKRRVVLEVEPELMKVQRKILDFIGKQTSKVCHAFVYSEEVNEIEPTSICGGNLHLKLTLPYEDVRVDIYLDVFVARIVNLALYSSDRKTKITACELLQATVMVFLGRAKSMSHAGLTELEDLLKVIAMPLLQLGCDIDQLVQQIFAPLVTQLIHWYASPSQLRGSHTAIMLDALMEGITHPTNSCLRDFSGICIREFVKWTIKQTSEQLLSTDPVNIKILVKKMRFFSTHSNSMKKLGAALIFNNIYVEIREEDSLIKTFWFEILHIFITSLSHIENSSSNSANTILQINKSLGHLKRVILQKPEIFRVSNEHRRVPSDIKGSTLKDVAIWLLKQTGSHSKHCREASMDLFVAIAPLTHNKKVNLKVFVNDVFKTGFISSIYEYSLEKQPTLKDIPYTEDCSVLFKWMQNLCCALDGCYFVIKYNLSDIDFNNTTFSVVNYFLTNIQEADMAHALSLICTKPWTFTTLDMEQFKKLKYTCILSILKVFNAIVSDEVLLKKSTTSWNDSVWKLILNVIFYPQLINLDDGVSHPKYLEILKILLNTLPQKMPASSISALTQALSVFIERNYNTDIDLKSNVTLLSRNLIKGILLLDSTNLNKHLNLEKFVNGLIDKLMQNFYQTLNDNTLYINNFQETIFEYCCLIFKLSLSNTKEFQELIKHLHQPYSVQSMEFNKEVKFGIFILSIFEDVILPSVLKKFDLFINLSLERNDLVLTVELTMYVLNFVLRNKGYDHHYEEMSTVLLSRWNVLEKLFNSDAEYVHLGTEYVKLFISISKSRDTIQLQYWLVNRLIQEEDLNNKLQLFDLIVRTIDDSSVKLEDDLKHGLLDLFNKITTVEASTSSFLFEKMLTSSIPNLKSTEIFKLFVKLYIKLTSDLDIGSLFGRFITNVSTQSQENVLETIYEMSKSSELDFQKRYKIIKNIVPSLFQACRISSLENFFVASINDIISRIQNGQDMELNILDFVLIEMLFSRVPIGSAERTVCPISDAANNPKLLNVFLKFTLEAFKKDSGPSKEILRLYKCHAYNALSSIVCNSVKHANFYEKLFARYDKDKEILWNGIIDTTITYNFPIFFDTIPSKRKIITSIRDELRAERKQEQQKSLKYISSQKLFSSSLSEDVTNFDFTNTTLRSQKAVDDGTDSKSVHYQREIQLDAVDLNNHECMATVCGLIQHIFDTHVNELPREEDEDVELPNWMKSIRLILLSNQTHKNIKLFLVKVIDNMIEIFNYYSKWFLEPLLQFVVDRCAGDNLNYFITDVICILSKWSSNIVQPSDRECKLANEMLLFLISNLSNERTDVFKYNLDLIKLIVESWKNYIEVPKTKLFEILTSETNCDVGIHLTSVFLVNNLEPWEESEQFITVLVKRMTTSKKTTYKPCAETIGLMLKYLNGMYSERIDTCLKSLGDDKYIYCLEGVAVHFPESVNAYHISKLISSLNQYTDTHKIIHLKIILKRVEVSLDILEEISDFKIVEWSDLIEHSNLEIQIITLKIINRCLSIFTSYRSYSDIIKALGRNIMNSNALYRSCIYDIAILVYTQDKDVLDICKEILIVGLIDDDADNKEKVVSFWRENSNLPNTVVNRFSYLFSHLYKTKIEEYFLSYVNFFLISALNSQPDFNNVIFEHPLEDCNFEEYRLQLNWRLQHPSVVPLFAETLTDTEPRLAYDNSNLFQLKETQSDLSFSPTQSVREQEFSKFTNLESSLSVSFSSSENTIKNPNDFVISQKYRLPKRRFLRDKSKISISFAHHETKKRVKKAESRISLAKEREKKVTLYRSYRKGDFPDIQILLSSILTPLQMLSLHDGEIARMLVTEIFKGIITKVENNETFLQSVLESIQYIFNNSTSFNPNLIGTLFDMLLKHKDKLRFDGPQLVTYVSQQSGLLSVGTLLLEEYLISSDCVPSGSKKGANAEENKETVYWVKLAELYKELGEWDIKKMHCKDIIQKAIQYESEAQWRGAQDLYAELIETDVSAERKDFYYESYFKCFANLGEWDDLPKEIESVVVSFGNENVWDILWDKDWCQQKLLPWYIQAQVKKTLFNQKWPEDFSNNLNKCLSCADEAEYLQANFSEELCILWLFKKDISSASIYLNSYIKNFLSNWQLLNPMYQSLRYDKILQLRNIIEVDEFISTYKNLSDDLEHTLKKLTSKWVNTSQEVLPSILLNETRVLYRTLFVNILKEKISNFEFVDISECVEIIEMAKKNLDMSLIDTAIELNNYYVSRKYFRKHANSEDTKFRLAYGNIAFLKAKLLADPQQKLTGLIQTVGIFSSLFSSTQDLDTTLLSANVKYFDVVTNISHLLATDQTLLLKFQDNLKKSFGILVNKPEDIDAYALNKLQLAVKDLGTENMDSDDNYASSQLKYIASAFVKLAYFIKDKNDENLQRDFILYVLRAMKLNSLEAKQLFPCILIQSRLGSDYAQLFIDETENIPTWMFLGWIPQLLANLDSKKIHALSKIVIRIAETYPQAIMYPYRLSKEHYRFTDSEIADTTRQLINKLDNLLLNDPMVDMFLKALSYVTVPPVMLRYYISKMYNAQKESDIKSIQETVITDMFKDIPNSKNVDSMWGNMYKNISKFKKDIENILAEKKIREKLTKIDKDLKKMVESEKASVVLKDYCPWLANFSANKLNLDLEIPGQYTGEKLPLPQHHIKVSGFYPNVMVMKSLRKPIKVTIIGMDTKEYPFLVKFGEDIRQDQRIEQLFGLMNDIFKSDTTCVCRNLEILTYQVIPLTSNLGIIHLKKISDDYQKWLYTSEHPAVSYGMSAIKYSRDKTIAFYRSLVNKISWDIIRKSFWSLSSTAENYISLRNNFIKSYAVLCTSQWILGIGDRHLNNSLICLRNGKVLGIDFGHAFGTATQIQPVPELVPFRLTPHIISLMEPLKERGQFRQCMIHSLKALRANYNSLLATMNVFIEEPSLDWLEHASKFENADEGMHNWYPNIKVNQTKRKLEGASSTKILVEDLVAGRKDPKYIEAYVKLVRGVPEFDKRTKFTSDNLSVEDQIDCLLDHATDYNLLGRMWIGWMPWV
ncbi:hypothetical protein NQ315_014127 [Exocentrus adspersus]|uniref:non-specific serine/threonine protein kinase n=1 Tax=Exocentrus adspersus TaxID=1586481 RepID=A0AAV8VV69_9CUCU|nr:hypothetical protein NQ315_014127 [Exocentrus adspersus]